MMCRFLTYVRFPFVHSILSFLFAPLVQASPSFRTSFYCRSPHSFLQSIQSFAKFQMACCRRAPGMSVEITGKIRAHLRQISNVFPGTTFTCILSPDRDHVMYVESPCSGWRLAKHIFHQQVKERQP